MIPYQITVYHNNDSRFLTYQDGHRLTATMSHWRHLPTGATEDLADWAFHVFNADLGTLERDRTAVHGEAAFLAACVYRLLGLRSLSVGDVVEVATAQDRWWLACESFGWKRISPPANRHVQPLSAETVYQHLHVERT